MVAHVRGPEWIEYILPSTFPLVGRHGCMNQLRVRFVRGRNFFAVDCFFTRLHATFYDGLLGSGASFLIGHTIFRVVADRLLSRCNAGKALQRKEERKDNKNQSPASRPC